MRKSVSRMAASRRRMLDGCDGLHQRAFTQEITGSNPVGGTGISPAELVVGTTRGYQIAEKNGSAHSLLAVRRSMV